MKEHLEDIKHIKSIIERSSKFISLSGYSGVSAGLVALIGLYWLRLQLLPAGGSLSNRMVSVTEYHLILKTALAMIVAATVLGLGFTYAKAKRLGVNVLNNSTAKNAATSLLIPLAVGGIFCLELLRYQLLWLCVPSTLVFYGFGLMAASRYTDRYTYLLGLAQVGLGCLALLLPNFALYFWALGFGFLHILYGVFLTFKSR